MTRTAPRTFVPSTLRARLALLSFIGSALIVGIAFGIVWANVGTIAERSLKQTLRRRATLLEREFAGNEAAVFAAYLCDVGRSCRPSTFLTPQQLEVAARQELFVDGNLPALGGESKVLAQPGVVKGRRVVVIVAAPSAEVREVRDRIRNLLLLGGPLGVGLATLGGWTLTGAALRPVRRMTDEATAIGGADSMRRLPVPPGNDEIANLGTALNSMLARIEASFRNERAFVDDASHELRTPLAILAGEIELGLLNTSDQQTRILLESLREETDRLARLADDLLVLARAGTARRSPEAPTLVNVAIQDIVARLRLAYSNDIVIEVIEMIEMIEVIDNNVAATQDGASAPDVASKQQSAAAQVVASQIPSEHLDRIVSNLLANARRFARRTVRITTTVEGALVHVQVADDGPGFAPELRATAFERFTVGNPARTRGEPAARFSAATATTATTTTMAGTTSAGTGLGLAIVRVLAERSGGRVRIDDVSPLGGAAVSVILPRA